MGIRTDLKRLGCFRIMRTGRDFDDLDDSTGIGEEALRGYFRLFCVHLVHQYGATYLNRRPSTDELV